MQLARTYKRTVVFTIHQPQSNIVALFDKLVLLAQGRVVYSGKADESQAYFESIGCACPPGFNIADYLSASSSLAASQSRSKSRPPADASPPPLAVDITAQKEKSPTSAPTVADALVQLDRSPASDSRTDPELGVNSRSRTPSSTSANDTELATRHSSTASSGPIRRFFSSASASSSSGSATPVQAPLPTELARLVSAFASSGPAQRTQREILAAKQGGATGGRGASGGAESESLRNYRRAGWWTQFTILSGRSFKNLYRDPMLMLSHYAVAVLAAGASSSRPLNPDRAQAALTLSSHVPQASAPSSSAASRACSLTLSLFCDRSELDR